MQPCGDATAAIVEQMPTRTPNHAPHLFVHIGIHLRPEVPPLRRRRVPVVEKAFALVRPGERREFDVLELVGQRRRRARRLVDGEDVHRAPVRPPARQRVRQQGAVLGKRGRPQGDGAVVRERVGVEQDGRVGAGCGLREDHRLGL